MFLRMIIVGSLFAVAVRYDERKMALGIGVLAAALIAVAEVVFGAGLSALTVVAFVANLGVCLLAMSILTSDPGTTTWLLTLGTSTFLLVFNVPFGIFKELLGG